MSKHIFSKFADYKHRSLPWLIANWKKKPVKQISSTEHKNLQQRSEQHIQELCSLFTYLSTCNNKRHAVESSSGFTIAKWKSSIPGAGNGVYVESGVVRKGSIAALYPGTVYHPSEPLFFQSLGNSFILRCVDGIYVDGNDRGISARLYRSAAGRDVIGAYESCDATWLGSCQKNPLAIGQYVNNATPACPANVTYQELDLPQTFPLHLLQYIPNVRFSGIKADSAQDDSFMRLVLLIALRDIQEGEELFSSYFAEVGT